MNDKKTAPLTARFYSASEEAFFIGPLTARILGKLQIGAVFWTSFETTLRNIPR
ncbi:MAG: hypothetical protein ACYC2I_12230 [Elusimicrobiales bacterium]